ncbi:MAG: efflux RND transporter periplasmic adaptor subunit [Asticcacaulis sp.]|uniref:efflux RND transporter periplasmic adaptor subunit n=1 Tax=Asticcacaulis sp. TaxID=1872648 RepID=UPI003F7C0371
MITRPLLATVLMLSAGLSACGEKPHAPAPVASSQPTLAVASAQVDDLKPVAATVTSYKMAQATARLAGVLTTLSVKEGDEVKAGQRIGFVQDSRIAPQTSAYAAAAAAADAQAVQAQAQYNRVKTLYDKGIYAKAALDQAEAAWKAAEANTRAARAQTAANAAYGDQGAIYAPDSGKVLTVDAPKGAVVMMGQSIATITSGAPVVRIELPEGQSQALQVGQSVRLEADGREATGSITRIYPSVTQGQVEADVTPAGFESLPVGAKVTAFVSLGKRQAILLPRSYVTTRYGLDYVKLAQKEGGVMETTVETAPYDAQHVEILGGLNPGDRVVSYGAR